MPGSDSFGGRSRDALIAEVRRRAARRRAYRRGGIAAAAVAACAAVAVPLALANGGGSQSVNVIAPPTSPTSAVPPAPTTSTTPVPPSTSTSVAPTTSTTSATTTVPANTVSGAGTGSLRIGMTLADAQKAAPGYKLNLPPAGQGAVCGSLTSPDGAISAVFDVTETGAPLFMVDVRTASLATSKGVKVGSTTADVNAAYPEATPGGGGYSIALSVKDGGNVLVFVFDTNLTQSQTPRPADKVTTLRAIRAKEAAMEEPCA